MMKKYLLPFVLVAGLMSGCAVDEIPADPPAPPVPTNVIRVSVVMPSSIKDGDTFVLAGGFATNAWSPDKSTLEIKKTATGKWKVDVPVTEISGTEVEYKVVRNPKNGDAWKFGEKSDKCDEITNRKLAKSSAGQETEITVVNFRNTGTCPN
jgi:hypothetical protein